MRTRGWHNAEMTAKPRKPLGTANQRYWASMIAIAVATILVAGLLGGTVTLLTDARAGRSSLWGGVVMALVMLAGWTSQLVCGIARSWTSPYGGGSMRSRQPL